MAECQHPRADRIFYCDGRRECGRCPAVLPTEAPTPVPVAWNGGHD